MLLIQSICSFRTFTPNTCNRTSFVAYTQFPQQWARMCHRGSFQSDGIAYTFSNGSAYPTNSQGPPLSQYAIVPNFCQV